MEKLVVGQRAMPPVMKIFLKYYKMGEGDVAIDWNDRVDAELYDVDWEIDDDSAMERTIDDADDYNEDDMEEFLNRVSIG